MCGWAEGCSCHEPLLRGRNRYQQHRALQADFGNPNFGCPLQGMRFPELVSGELRRIASKVTEIAVADLLTQSSVWCAPGEWAIVLQDFGAAQEQCCLILDLKTSFIGKLPWMFGALAHHDASVVADCAKRALGTYDAMPSEAQVLLPALVNKFLSKSRSLRHELVKLSEGIPLEQLSRRAQRNIAVFRFFNIAERTIEGAHRDIKTPAGYRKFNANKASLAARATTILERAIHTDASFLVNLCSKMQIARSMRKLATDLHCCAHPLVLELREQAAFRKASRQAAPQSTRWQTIIAQIVYRTDTHSMLRSLEKQDKEHKKNTRSEQAHARKVIPKKERLSAQAILAHCLLDRIRSEVH